MNFGTTKLENAALVPKLPVALGKVEIVAVPLGKAPVLKAPPLAVGTVAVFAAGVAYAKVEVPTINPFEARETLVPFSVIAGPPMESVVPATTTAVLSNGVNVSPPAVSALLLALLLSAVASGMVDVPIIKEPAGLIE